MAPPPLSLAEALSVLWPEHLAGLSGKRVLVVTLDGTLEWPPLDQADCCVRLPAASALASLAQAGRFDLGLVAAGLQGLPAAGARSLLAALRDRLCRVTLVVEPVESPWHRAEMLALAFTKKAASPCGAWQLFDHDIASYNPGREWNTPADWAHPENFGRYRW